MNSRDKLLLQRLEGIFNTFTLAEIKHALLSFYPTLNIQELRALKKGIVEVRRTSSVKGAKDATSAKFPSRKRNSPSTPNEETFKASQESVANYAKWLKLISQMNEELAPEKRKRNP